MGPLLVEVSVRALRCHVSAAAPSRPTARQLFQRSERRRRGRGASSPADDPSATWPSASSPSRPLVHGPDEQDASSVRWSSFVVSPQTILRWHRESVKGKWTYKRISAGGRPPFQRGRPAACLESRELRRTPSSRWRGCSKTWASHPGRRRRALVSDACMLLRGVPAHWSLPSAGIRRARGAIGSDRSPRSGSPDAFQDQQGEPSGRDRDGVERKAAISRNPRSG